jgi:S-adenosylmethionine synthetase
VLAVSQALDDASVTAALPVGRDIKVMGYRHGSTVELTVAAAMLATRLGDRPAYDEAVGRVRRVAAATASAVTGTEVSVAVNQADRAGAPYLTLTGTSGEAGDDGQVGRGNRFGGLITPHRSMSLEACAGKNPIGHVGKTYHAVAWDAAHRLLDQSAGETTVRVLSRIGNPVTQPQAVHVETTRPIDPAVIEDAVTGALTDWRGITRRFLDGAYPIV